MERVAIIGGSRGLGAELVRTIPSTASILAVGRSADRLSQLKNEHIQVLAADVRTDFDLILSTLKEFRPNRVFYLAGGGPYGPFQKKAWKDHVWAWEVTFLSAARLVHALLNDHASLQIILCGSSVAENEGDPSAASYASAKHALKGLYQTLRLENPALDIRLFSPGYLDTELLPKGAPVRYKGVWNPEVVAKKFWDWACSSDHASHLSLSRHP